MTTSVRVFHHTILCAIAVSCSAAAAQGLNPADLQFCNETANYIQSQSQRQSSSGSSGGFGASFLIGGIPMGVNAQSSDNLTSSSLSTSIHQYNEKKCDALLQYYGMVDTARITAAALIRISEIQASAQIAQAQIGANASMHNSDNQLSAVRVSSDNQLSAVVDSNKTLVKVSQGNNQSTLINTGIQSGISLLGGLIGASQHSKDNQLELQMQREKQQHEIRMLELQLSQRNAQPKPNEYPTQPNPSLAAATAPYLNSASQSQRARDDTNASNALMPVDSPQSSPSPESVARTLATLTPEEEDISKRFNLQIDKSCNPSGVIIKLENATTVCASPTTAYPSGRYMLRSDSLVRY